MNNKKNNIVLLHEIAMEFVHEAELAHKKGEASQAKSLYQKAYHIEKRYAEMIPDEPRYRLGKSITYRSAVNLAVQSEYWEEAISLAETALDYNLEPFLREEIIELLNEAKSKAPESNKSEKAIIIGILIGADLPNRTIKIMNAEDKKYYGISTTEQKIDAIVKSFWRKQVEITSKTNKSGSLSLENIRQVA